MHTADSCCCTAETNTALQSNYTPMKFFLKIWELEIWLTKQRLDRDQGTVAQDWQKQQGEDVEARQAVSFRVMLYVAGYFRKLL